MKHPVKTFKEFMIEQPMGKPAELVTDADMGQNSGFYNPHRHVGNPLFKPKGNNQYPPQRFPGQYKNDPARKPRR